MPQSHDFRGLRNLSTFKSSRYFNLKINISKSKLQISPFTPIPNMFIFQLCSLRNSSFLGPKLEPSLTRLFFFFTRYKNPSKKSCHPYIQNISRFQSLLTTSSSTYYSAPGHYILHTSLLIGLPCLCPHPSDSLFLIEQPRWFIFKSYSGHVISLFKPLSQLHFIQRETQSSYTWPTRFYMIHPLLSLWAHVLLHCRNTGLLFSG